MPLPCKTCTLAALASWWSVYDFLPGGRLFGKRSSGMPSLATRSRQSSWSLVWASSPLAPCGAFFIPLAFAALLFLRESTSGLDTAGPFVLKEADFFLAAATFGFLEPVLPRFLFLGPGVFTSSPFGGLVRSSSPAATSATNHSWIYVRLKWNTEFCFLYELYKTILLTTKSSWLSRQSFLALRKRMFVGSASPFFLRQVPNNCGHLGEPWSNARRDQIFRLGYPSPRYENVEVHELSPLWAMLVLGIEFDLWKLSPNRDGNLQNNCEYGFDCKKTLKNQFLDLKIDFTTFPPRQRFEFPP